MWMRSMLNAGKEILFASKEGLFQRKDQDVFRLKEDSLFQQNKEPLFEHEKESSFPEKKETLIQQNQETPFQHKEKTLLQLKKKETLLLLKKDILLQRFSWPCNKGLALASLHPFASAFPFNQFPLGCVHEFICHTNESFSASSAFVCGILSSLKLNKGNIIWISSSGNMFPPSFTSFGISPHNIIFIRLDKPKDILFTTEESLRCKGISAVITDIRELNFKQSRRLQLTTEQSRVTGFILRNKPKSINTTACVSRWIITPAPGTSYQNLPGIGFPSWNVELQKVRNGKPQSWSITWQASQFIHDHDLAGTINHHKKVV
jgi:protein ImuA